MSPTVIRDADPGTDAGACAAIYCPYVLKTAITFETEPPDASEMARRIAAAQQAHAWLVGELDGRAVGYAYGGPFRTRAAYRRSAEVSIYLELGRRRTGLGRALYAALLERLTEQGYAVALGGMTLPNEASVALHRALGFTPVGTFHRVGFKLDRWHDVAWVERPLGEASPQP